MDPRQTLFELHRIEWRGGSTRTASRLLTALTWCDTEPLCRGSLGIPRKEMPQIKEHALPWFVEWLADQGVRTRRSQQTVKNLRATQKEIFPSLVERLMGKDIEGFLARRPVLASMDGYILDGHHRWATLLLTAPETKLNLVQVMAPIRSVLELAHQFPGVQYSTREASLRAKLIRLAYAEPDLRQDLLTLLDLP